jgi:predicted transposase YbfD/YdcC
MLYPKKVGTLPVADRDEEKQTNEIKTAIPLLQAIDIEGKTITADALLTQREFARYLIEDRHARSIDTFLRYDCIIPEL